MKQFAFLGAVAVFLGTGYSLQAQNGGTAIGDFTIARVLTLASASAPILRRSIRSTSRHAPDVRR